MVDSDAEEFGKCRVRVKDFVALADVDTRHLYTEIRDTARSIRSKELVQLNQRAAGDQHRRLMSDTFRQNAQQASRDDGQQAC
jgi:hypothetical protein